MTDRLSGYLVTLDQDIREDDAEEIVAALRMIKFVASVTPVRAGPLDDQIIRLRRDHDWRATLATLLRDGPAEAGR